MQTSIRESITIKYCQGKELYDLKLPKQFKRLKASDKLKRKDKNFCRILLCPALVCRDRFVANLANALL
ncbi:MAG: hypothetical protein COV66_08270 [Nitrospinae bacterium CG11_big_fil_rev_8_21_14_0_20_45_15]|nr:MAG: hypothetical protein COV66_08270 [Nitrospinae bacterium CG11_big_fil_rev_8_21_14_0_20_45_15]